MPIPGTRSRARVEENVAAADLTLSPDDLTQIDHILPHGGVRRPLHRSQPSGLALNLGSGSMSDNETHNGLRRR